MWHSWLLYLVGCGLVLTLPGSAESESGDTFQAKTIIERLADPGMAGRQTGTEAGERAAVLVDSLFAVAGLQALPEENSRLLSFEWVTGVMQKKNSFKMRMPTRMMPSLVDSVEWLYPAWSAQQTVNAEVLAAGYGIMSHGKSRWDDYAHRDVQQKILLIQQGLPSSLSASSSTSIASRVRLAEKMGVAGLIICADPFEGHPLEDLVDHSLFEQPVGIPVVYVTSAVGDSLLRGKGYTSKTWVSRMNRARKSLALVLPNQRVELNCKQSITTRSGSNVVGWWPGQGQGVLALSAHFDHLGLVDSSIPAELGNVYCGADDNASGVAAMLRTLGELKKTWPQGPPLAGIVLLAFDAEEQGLRGSRHLAQHMPLEAADIRLLCNMDMVGRLDGRPLNIFGAGRIPGSKDVLSNNRGSLELAFNDLSISPSDHSSFLPLGVPAVMLFSGTHDDYNTPHDTADRIDYDGLSHVIAFLTGAYTEIASQGLSFQLSGVVEQVEQKAPVRVSMGITPGYGGEGKGMEITRVSDSSPAANAGLKAGDRLLSMGVYPVTNIFDYTFALRNFQIGDDVALRILRGGQELDLHVILQERHKK